jgi:hypothetical protein
MPEPIQTPEDGTEVVPPVALPPEGTPPAAPVVDYEKKFQESSRENQLLRDAQAARERAEQDLTKEPTDSELRSAFPDWDNLDDFQKNLARRTFNSERIAQRAAKTSQELAAERAWTTSVELTIHSNASLQDKEQAFRQYASQPKYRNVPMDVLVDAFLQKNGGTPAPKPTPKPGLETGNGGPRTPDRPKLMSSTELQTLRKSDEKAYLAYIKTHDVSAIE